MPCRAMLDPQNRIKDVTSEPKLCTPMCLVVYWQMEHRTSDRTEGRERIPPDGRKLEAAIKIFLPYAHNAIHKSFFISSYVIFYV